MAQCAYCKEDKKMSREHIFSQTLLRLYDDVAPLTFDQQRGIVHKGDPLIKDLCRDCNSGLSESDAAIRIFAESHLREFDTNHDEPRIDPALLKLWVVKTAANLSRANGSASEWWHRFIPFMRRETPDADCDVLFSRWEDTSPFGFASAGGAVMCIEGREALLFGLATGGSTFLRTQLAHAEAVKVGYGVFLLLAWKEDAEKDVREQTVGQLRSFGWFTLGDPFWIAPSGFNLTSCATFNMIAKPDENLIEVMRADKLR